MMKSIILLFTIFVFLLSCNTTQDTTPDKTNSIADSLDHRCYDLLLRLQTDSLRNEAEVYMNAVPPQSEKYFTARQYYINSWFNAKDYGRVLQMLDETERMEKFHQYPAIEANYLYTRARCYQFTQRYEEAIQTLRQVMNIQPTDTSSRETIRKLSVGAMNNVTNISYFTGKTAEGFKWFRTLRSAPPALLEECCQRDMLIFQAYLAYLSRQSKVSEALVDSAFALPLYKKTPEYTFRDYSFAATILYSLPHREKDVESMLRYAIAEGRKEEYTPGISWAMNVLANYYQEKHLFGKSVKLQYEALAAAVQKQDSAAIARSFSDLGNIYYLWNFHPQAELYADKALKWGNQKNISTDWGNFYRLKYLAQKSQRNGRGDLRYLVQSDSCIGTPTFSNSYLKAEELIFNYPKLLTEGINILTTIPARFPHEWTAAQAKIAALKTIALIKQGKEKEAQQSLLSIKKYHSASPQRYLDTLMNHYLHLDNPTAIVHLVKLREPLLKEYADQKNRKDILAADIRYKTLEKDAQINEMNAQLKIKTLRSNLHAVLSVGLVLLMMGSLFYYKHRIKLQRLSAQLSEQQRLLVEKRLEQREKELQESVIDLKEANERNVMVEKELSEFINTSEGKKKVIQLTPQLLQSGEEGRFRRIFTEMHPDFILSLRKNIPGITAGEELLCMLIVLGQTPDEISYTLCISKTSIHQSRYRLRKKTSLLHKEALEEYLLSILDLKSNIN